MRKNKFLAALAIAACLATSIPLSANAATLGQAKDASKVVYGTVSDANKALLLSAFDAAYYAKENPDVVSAGYKTDAELFNHFVTAGIFEGRAMNADFNPSAYKSCYDDLAKAFGDDVVAYYIHYITNGSKAPENRKATVDAVTKAGYDVYSIIDGSKVASKYVAPAAPASSSSSDSSSSNPSNPGTVTDASAEKLAKLEKDLKDAQELLAKAQAALAAANADKDASAAEKAAAETAKAEAEAAKEAAEKALEDYKNAQGDKSGAAEAEAAKYNDLSKTTTTLSGEIPTTSVAYVPDGAVEVRFNNNVWYEYTDGKFYTYAKTSDRGTTYHEAELVLKPGYINVDGKYYETYDLAPYKVLPYMINLNMNDGYDWKNYVDKAGNKLEEPWFSDTTFNGLIDDRKIADVDDPGQYAVVPYYVNKSGEKKYMKIVSGGTVDPKWADQKGYFNILGEYVTKNPMTFDSNDGELSDYWVNVDDKYYVAVHEQTTYLDKTGEWNYKRDAYGNQIYVHVGGMAPNNDNDEYWIPAGPDLGLGEGIRGFIELNTDKNDHLALVRSPYLREVQKDEKDAYQYSAKFVANTNEAVVEPADAEVAPGVSDYDLEIGAEMQKRNMLASQNGYETSVTAGSIIEGSWGSLQQFHVQDWTRFDSQDEALVTWYEVHYTYGGLASYTEMVEDECENLGWNPDTQSLVEFILANYTEEAALRILRHLHIDEYYEEIATDDGYILCLADEDGFAVVDHDGDGDYDRVDGSKTDIAEYDLAGNRQIFVRAFQYIETSKYKDACNQNLLQFHYNAAAKRYYVDTEYEGAVWYDDYEDSTWKNMAFADWYRDDVVKGDPRWDDFVKLGWYSNWAHRDATAADEAHVDGDVEWLTDGRGNGYAGRTSGEFMANGKWLDETGLVISEDRLAKLKGSKENKNGYVYVKVTIYDYNEETDTLVISPDSSEGEDRWYKAESALKAERPEDALYDANANAWYYNKPVSESVATVLVPGWYDHDVTGIVKVEVKSLKEAFNLQSIDYPVFTVVQAKENGRFYAVRDYSVQGH